MRKHLALAAISSLMVIGLAGPATAHPHTVTAGNGATVTLAKGANHTPFVAADDGSGLRSSCGLRDGHPSNHAVYGLETAHHGPDQSPGRGDGCYTIMGSPLDPDNDRNPAIG